MKTCPPSLRQKGTGLLLLTPIVLMPIFLDSSAIIGETPVPQPPPKHATTNVTSGWPLSIIERISPILFFASFLASSELLPEPRPSCPSNRQWVVTARSITDPSMSHAHRESSLTPCVCKWFITLVPPFPTPIILISERSRAFSPFLRFLKNRLIISILLLFNNSDCKAKRNLRQLVAEVKEKFYY